MRKAAGSALLLLSGLVVAVAAAEGMVRLLAPHTRDHVTPRGLFRLDRSLGWTLKPGARVRHRSRYFDVEYMVNGAGFRDEPGRSPHAPGSKRRILFFGDSQVFGWGVDTAHRFTSVVGKRMPDVEALNLAAPGYGLDQQILSYESIKAANPNATVLLMVSTATIKRSMQSESYRKPKPRFVIDSAGRLVRVPVSAEAGRMTDLAYRMLGPFYLPYFVEVQWLRLKGSGRFRAPGSPPAPVTDSAFRLQEALLLEAKRLASLRGHNLVVLASVDRRAEDALRDFCAASGIGFVDTPWHEAPAELVFGPDDLHWRANAHQQVADRLLPHLVHTLPNDSD
jgi:hypothetical protein